MENQKLSAYVLTKNSEQYLALVLQQLQKVADELIIIDSGSIDRTEAIVKSIPSARFIYRRFDNFVAQRNFAANQCSYNWIIFVDSDEVLNDETVAAINELKKTGFQHDAYFIARNWIVLGKPVHSLYPCVTPDHVIRLYNRNTTSYKIKDKPVHEHPTGYQSCGFIPGALQHYTFNSVHEIKQKLQLYTDLELENDNLLESHRLVTLFKYYLRPIAIWIKYYLIKGGYRDGKVGLILGKYAYDYNKIKYAKALRLLNSRH